MKTRTKIGSILLAAGVASALAGPASAPAAAPAPTPSSPTLADGQTVSPADGVTIGGESHVVPMDDLPLALRRQFDALHASDTPAQRAAQLAASDPSCYPYGTEIHGYWIRYEFDGETTLGATAGSARIDKVWHDDCYQVLGELQGPGLSALMTADLTTAGQIDFNQPTFPAAGVYEWHKYRSDQAAADGGIAYPHGMHSFKRTVRFDFKGSADLDHNITMGMDSYAALSDYLCWFREDVHTDGSPQAPRGEGCYFIG